MTTRLLALALGFSVACKAPVGVQNVELSPDSAGQCAAHCRTIGLELDAVVVMANNVGCVCRAAAPAMTAPGAARTSSTASSSAGGLTAVLIQIEEQRRQQAAAAQRQQQQQQR